MIQDYFGSIPKGSSVSRVNIKEAPITKEIKGTYNDPNIQIPAIVSAYRTPSMKTRDAYVLNMVSTVLSDGKSSRLYKKLVDEKKMALQVGAFSVSQEDYGMYLTYGLPLGDTKLEDLVKEIDEEIVKMQTELITEREFEKLQNKYENQFVNSNASIEGIANSLARYYMLYGDINLINNEIEYLQIYHKRRN